MKRAIVIILVILLVAGGGAGGLIMMGVVPNPFNPQVQGPPLTGAERAAKELAEKKFQGPTAAFNLIKLDDMIIPVIMNGQVRRKVFIIARLMVDQPANESAVEANVRKYQDAVISDLVPYLQDYYRTHDSIDAAMMKERLTAAAKKVYGDMVHEVLLINIFDQSMGR